MSCCPEWKGAGSGPQGHKGMDNGYGLAQSPDEDHLWLCDFEGIKERLCAPPFPCLQSRDLTIHLKSSIKILQLQVFGPLDVGMCISLGCFIRTLRPRVPSM